MVATFFRPKLNLRKNHPTQSYKWLSNVYQLKHPLALNILIHGRDHF